MIFAHSRYETVEQIFVTDGDVDRKRVVEFPRYYATEFVARRHVIREGERLDQLASQYYDEPEMWWVIAVANPELFYPEDIDPGTVIRIPDAPSIL